ncbi:hypothetical protein HY095_03185 [Candidatus Micrarchaeota archaeon]|nr:hypothetical protein [Candidatus Micrarchaeota archaeon]
MANIMLVVREHPNELHARKMAFKVKTLLEAEGHAILINKFSGLPTPNLAIRRLSQAKTREDAFGIIDGFVEKYANGEFESGAITRKVAEGNPDYDVFSMHTTVNSPRARNRTNCTAIYALDTLRDRHRWAAVTLEWHMVKSALANASSVIVHSDIPRRRGEGYVKQKMGLVECTSPYRALVTERDGRPTAIGGRRKAARDWLSQYWKECKLNSERQSGLMNLALEGLWNYSRSKAIAPKGSFWNEEGHAINLAEKIHELVSQEN